MILPGDRLEDARDHLGIIIGVDHDRGTLAGLGIGGQPGVEPLVAPAVAEPQRAPAPFQEHSQAVVVLLLREHLPRHLLRQGLVGPTRQRLLHADGESRQVGRGRPQARGRHLRVDVPFPLHEAPILEVRGRGAFRLLGRQRLFEGAFFHAERPEHGLLHERREWFAGHVDDHLLHDGVAAAGVSPLAAGRHIDPDGPRVGGFHTVQDLHEGGERPGRVVAGEAVDRQPGGMAEESAQGDLLLLGERVLRHFPGDEPGVHVLIEGELALFDQSQRPQARHGLADRTGLEERGGRHRRIAALLRHAIARRLDDLAVLDDGQGEAGDPSLLHLGPDHLVDGVGTGIGRRRSEGAG